jgi:hypothetical protein
MFDVSAISKRYFSIKLTATDDDEKEHSVQLDVGPAKVKALKKLVSVSKAAKDDASEDAMDELAESRNV